MATFKNVSGEDREVSVDGRSIFVENGGTFAVADEHAPTLRHQPHFLADDDTLASWEAEEAEEADAEAAAEAKRAAEEAAAKLAEDEAASKAATTTAEATKTTTKGGKN